MLLLPTYVAGNVSGIGKLSIINGKSFLKKMFLMMFDDNQPSSSSSSLNKSIQDLAPQILNGLYIDFMFIQDLCLLVCLFVCNGYVSSSLSSFHSKKKKK